MFCPQCRTEYREGFTNCADCGIALMDKPVSIPKENAVRFEEVYSTHSHIEIAILKSILQTEEIPYYFNNYNDFHRHLFQPAVLWVWEEKAERAREIIAEVQKKSDVASDIEGIADDEG